MACTQEQKLTSALIAKHPTHATDSSDRRQGDRDRAHGVHHGVLVRELSPAPISQMGNRSMTPWYSFWASASAIREQISRDWRGSWPERAGQGASSTPWALSLVKRKWRSLWGLIDAVMPAAWGVPGEDLAHAICHPGTDNDGTLRTGGFTPK